MDRVRRECDATSEVAQAISKLQVGLNQVVSKTDSSAFINAIDEIPDSIVDPLASAPTPGAVGPANSGRFAVTPRPTAAKTAAAKPNWQLYAPILAVVAVIVTVLPLMAFFFSQAGRRSEAIVTEITQAPEDSGGRSGSGGAGTVSRERIEQVRRQALEAQAQKQKEAERQAAEQQAPERASETAIEIADAPQPVSEEVASADRQTAPRPDPSLQPAAEPTNEILAGNRTATVAAKVVAPNRQSTSPPNRRTGLRPNHHWFGKRSPPPMDAVPT